MPNLGKMTIPQDYMYFNASLYIKEIIIIFPVRIHCTFTTAIENYDDTRLLIYIVYSYRFWSARIPQCSDIDWPSGMLCSMPEAMCSKRIETFVPYYV